MTKIAPPPPPQHGPIERAVKEALFLAIIVVVTYALFTMMVLEWGGFLTNGSKALDPIMKKVGIFSPFLLWAVYVVMHRGWMKKLAAFLALIICTAGLIYFHGHSNPSSFSGSIMQIVHKHYGG